MLIKTIQSRLILSHTHFEITLMRLCHQLIENHEDFSDSVILGLQPRGILLAKRIHQYLSAILPEVKIPYGDLDTTFFRDDFRRREPLLAASTNVDFIIENKKVILIDDVLFTGRSVRAGLDALLVFGRPAKVELLVLVDRKYTRELPIAPDYVGIKIDSVDSERVKVNWKQLDGADEVMLLTGE